MTDSVHTIKETETASTPRPSQIQRLGAVGQRYRIVYRVERREVVVVIVAVGRRKASDKNDIYELAKKLLRLGLLR